MTISEEVATPYRKEGAGPRLSAPAAVDAAARRIPGEEGIWVLVLADLMVFATLFVTYLYYRGKTPAAFAHDQQSLNVGLGTLNTVLLLSSSLIVALGVVSMLSGRHRRAPHSFAIALACGVGFIAVKAAEWSHLVVAGKTPAAGGLYMYYFAFTGLHFLHVVIGCVVLCLMIRATRATQLTTRTTMLCECGGIWWHMVDLLWVVLFALFYLVR